MGGGGGRYLKELRGWVEFVVVYLGIIFLMNISESYCAVGIVCGVGG